jgi:DUF177 domain-containing protein
MQIWLDQVRDEPFNWDEIQSVSPEVLDVPELLALGPVRWRGQVVFADPGFFLRARLSYEQTLSCNRCLQPIVEPTDSEVELMILVDDRGEPEVERALTEQEMGVLYLHGEILETQPMLVEQLQLNVPMKPLCRPDCQGLCPRCGADKNAGPCSCVESSPDPRWAALAALKGRLDER